MVQREAMTINVHAESTTEMKKQTYITDAPLKWRGDLPREHLKDENPQSPPVHSTAVTFALNHLGRQVLRGSTECPGPVQAWKEGCRHTTHRVANLKSKYNKLHYLALIIVPEQT